MSSVCRTIWLCAWILAVTGHAQASGVNFSADLKLGGDDYDGFFSRQGEADRVFYLRELELGMEYAPNPHWSLELEAQWGRLHGENEFELGDALVRYQGWKGFDLQVGRMKEPFGMERLMSSSSLSVSERSVATSAFAPGRSIGAQLIRHRKRLTWHLGLFREESQSNDATEAITARLAWAPIQSDSDTLHLGGALSQRWHQGDPFQIREEGEVFSADTVLRSPRIDADYRTLGGLEFAWIHQSLTLSAEHMAQQVRDQDGVNWRFDGQYVQAAWLLTGERRAYGKGLIKGIDVLNPYGAWELIARYSRLDARDHARGSVSQIALLGVSVWLPKHVKFTLNLLDANIKGDLRSPEDSGRAISARVQVGL